MDQYNNDQDIKRNLLYPRLKFRGDFKPENLMFDDNLQQFSQEVSYIVGLEINGKITPYIAYQRIKRLYKKLKNSKNNLSI